LTDELTAREKEAVSRITALVLANAMIFQEVLSEHDNRVPSLGDALKETLFRNALIEHWDFIIRKINYYPIFHLAGELLLDLSSNRFLTIALRRLAGDAQKIVDMHVALGHDLMGRVYHRLLADAKYLATYYTGIPAATLLLKLALQKDCVTDWHDLEELRKLRVADLACGTGTLLMAAAEAITDNYVSECARQGKPVDLAALHQTLAADVLYGYDVLASALHLTASTLALRAPEVVFPRMQLFSLPLGGEGRRLGSIEFLEGNLTQMQTDLFGERTPARRVRGTDEQEMMNAGLPELDLCVMNPPFTRSVGGNLLFGSAPDEERKEMQRRLKQLVSKPGVRANITAGLGSVFVAVADRHIKQGGRIALVLPKALLSGVAWNETRELLRGKYQVEYIVVSHDPEHWNFSESTDLSEVLLVARKTAANGPRHDNGRRVVALNLWRNPSTTFDALAIVHDLCRRPAPDLADGQGALQVGVGESKMGEAVSVPWTDLRDQYCWLLPCAFAQSDLIRAAKHLTVGELWLPGHKSVDPVPLCPLRQIASLGPDRRDVHDGFVLSRAPTPYPAFWGHDASAVYTLRQCPNTYLSPRPEPQRGRHLRKVTDLWPLAGRVLVAERMWLKTQRLMAVYVEQPVLSNVWWPLSMHETADLDLRSKALALWLNCTPGMILSLAYRQETRGAWVDFKKPVLAAMPVLAVGSLTETQLTSLASAYDRLAGESLSPLPEMAWDPIRAQVDDQIASALDLPDLSPLRTMLGREPIVCLNRL
jgi:hypothetical protein